MPGGAEVVMTHVAARGEAAPRAVMEERSGGDRPPMMRIDGLRGCNYEAEDDNPLL